MHERQAIPRPALVMTILALLPLILLLAAIWSPLAHASAEGLAGMLRSYAAALAALMGGAHWALAAGPYGSARIAREWLIGLAALVTAWLALISPLPFGLVLLIAAYFLFILRDVLMAEAAALPPWFAKTRNTLAAGAIVTSILALMRILI